MERLQARVEDLADLLLQKRRPFFIEFAGTPKSGKTSTIAALEQFFKRNGVKVKVYQERASVAPLGSKGSTLFNVWVTFATLTGMIEALENEKLDVLILDRGLFDGLVWNDFLEETLRLSNEEASAFRSFVLTPHWRELVDVLFVMHCDPAEAMRREYVNQITLKRGSVMNEESLSQLEGQVLRAAKRYRRHFRNVHLVNTSEGNARGSIMGVATTTVDALERFLDEEVLCIPRTAFSKLIGTQRATLRMPHSWDSIRRTVDQQGHYMRRSAAEVSETWIQIVPVCVIEHNGKYLTNLRYEPGETLDDTLANWAGGHVRKEDLGSQKSKWRSVLNGLKREVYEELTLAQLPSKPIEFGLVHTTETPRAARHLGIVFLVHLQDPAAAAMLEGKIFRERPNKHVRTTWMEPGSLIFAPKQKDWSVAIGQHIAQHSHPSQA